MKKIRKNLIVAALAAAMLVSSAATNVSALSYGEEWTSYYKEAPVEYSDVDEDYWAYNAIMRTSDKNWACLRLSGWNHPCPGSADPR